MAKKFAAHDALGVACLGLTHPHTSGRVKAMQRLAGTRMLGAADDSPLIKPFAKALDLEIPSKAAILSDPDGGESREDAAGAVLNDADKIVVVDFFSWDPLPWLESWDLTAYGSAGIMPSRPLPASYKIYDTGKTGAARRLDGVGRDELSDQLGVQKDRILPRARRDRQSGLFRS